MENEEQRIDRESIQEMKGLIDGVVGNIQGMEKRLETELELIRRLNETGRRLSQMLKDELSD